MLYRINGIYFDCNMVGYFFLPFTKNINSFLLFFLNLFLKFIVQKNCDSNMDLNWLWFG